jgi:drug/metabolite transporter (DMT)-like permease
LNTAVFYTSAARVALIFATLPAVSLLIDVMRGRTFGGWRTGLGVALSIGGVAVLVGVDAMTGGIRGADVIGMAAAAGATLCVAICSSLYAPFVKRYGTIKVSTVAFTASMVPLGIIAIILPSTVTPDRWSGMIWWLVLAIGLSSGIGYLMWFHAIEKLPSTLVTGFLALSPVTAAVLSLIFLEAAVTPSLLIATALVCGGIACFARFQSRPTDRKVRPL